MLFGSNGRAVTIDGAADTATGTILNDDAAQFSIATPAGVNENLGSIDRNSRRLNPITRETRVPATTFVGTAGDGTGGTDNDFTPQSTELVFAAGETSQDFTVVLTSDSKVEADATLFPYTTLFRSNGRAVTIDGAADTATGTILNDDAAQFSIATPAGVNENLGS